MDPNTQEPPGKRADWITVWSSGRFGTECLPKSLYKQSFQLVYVYFALCNLFGLPGGATGH